MNWTYLDHMSIATEVSCEVLLCDVGGQAIQPHTGGRHALSKPQLEKEKAIRKIQTETKSTALLAVCFSEMCTYSWTI